MRGLAVTSAVLGAIVAISSCGGGGSSGGPGSGGGGQGGSGATGATGGGGLGGSSGDASVACTPVDLTLTSAQIDPSLGQDAYAVQLAWNAVGAAAGDQVTAELAVWPDAPYAAVMAPVEASAQSGTAQIDKLSKDIYVRLRWERPLAADCSTVTAPVRLAKPDYREPSDWATGWIRVVSHTHTISDVKADVGGPVHANRINWYNGCFAQLGNDAACHELLERSFAETGVQWLMDAAKDKGIGAVIITDHDNVGIWFTDVFRKYDKASATEPSVVRGLEWTSALGHLTVVGNFLPDVPPSASIFDLSTAKQVHLGTPLPKDECDDTDENHDVNSPLFDGPDAPCKRADHRGHGDDPITVSEATASIKALHSAGALVYANHPTQNAVVEPPMKWQLENLDLLDGVELATPDPTLTNQNTDKYWNDQGLMKGYRWVGIAGTDCHVNGPPYNGSTGCSSFHGLIDLTHMDAPYMWVKPLTSTSHVANNAPELVTAALREGRVAVAQDVDPAAIADLGIDANGDGKLDYVSGSTIPACEQPTRDTFDVQIRVKPVQTHNYNISVWKNGKETNILQDTVISAGQVWTGSTTVSRKADLPSGAAFGHVWVWVRENKTLQPDNDAAFTNPIWFEAPDPSTTPCNTRTETGG